MGLIDMDLADSLIGLVKSAASLFTVFPINIFLIGSLVGLGFEVFSKAKDVAK